MKDKKAREELAWLKEELRQKGLSPWLGNLRNVSIKHCPRCKHDVIAVEKYTPKNITSNCTVGGTYYVLPDDTFEYYHCLTCGSKFTCSNECVCKIMED